MSGEVISEEVKESKPHLLIINDENPIASEHICWFTKESNFLDKPNHIILYEVREVTYRHPEALDIATVKKLETRSVKVLNRSAFEAATPIVLEAIQKAVTREQLARYGL